MRVMCDRYDKSDEDRGRNELIHLQSCTPREPVQKEDGARKSRNDRSIQSFDGALHRHRDPKIERHKPKLWLPSPPDQGDKKNHVSSKER